MPRSVETFAPIVLVSMTLLGCGGRQAGHPSASPVPRVTVPSSETEATPALPPPTFAIRVPVQTLRRDDFGAQLFAELDEHGRERRDLTTSARWSAEPAGVVSVVAGYAWPLRAGRVKIRSVVEGRSAETTLEVLENSPRPWDFAEDIVPLLTRAGCNSGGCHGRATGQNGFHLSLFGYDPEADHAAITRREGGRRISPGRPTSSLLLAKGTGAIPHTGGPRFAIDSVESRTIAAWIGDGAPRTRGPAHGPLAEIKVEPKSALLDGPGERQFRVVARYGDGSERDVTRQSGYQALDDSAARIDPNGRATLLRRAETDLIVRYGSRVVSARIGAPMNPGVSFDFKSLARRNVIDEELFRRLEARNVPPSPAAGDTAWLRRVMLDLIGRQPRPEQVRAFLADSNPLKRTNLIEELLKDRDFSRFWLIKVGDLLEVTSARPEFISTAGTYQSWLSARLVENAPWDRVVYDLLTVLGDPASKESAPANYALESADPKIQAEKAAQRFLGYRLRCAQCHDHPFDVWTQDDYYGLAAIFARAGPTSREMETPGMNGRIRVGILPGGTVEHLRTGRPASPRLLAGWAIEVAAEEDTRVAFARWLTEPSNPQFSRATVNWVWAQFFGRGIANPPDDLSAANPPVHPELLDALARHFVAHKFDLRDLIRTIVSSEAYGLSSAPAPGNAEDDRLFSHHRPRPLTAQQMADAVAQVTDVVNRFRDKPAGTRAIEVADPATPSLILDTFGRCSRVAGCAEVPTPDLSLRQSLLLIGGEVIDGKVSSPGGYLENLLDLKPSPGEIVENLYYRTLCRPPSRDELARWTAELSREVSIREAAQDLFWALLSSREFAFNH